MQIIFKQAFGKKLDCSLIDEQGFGRYEKPISKHGGMMESSPPPAPPFTSAVAKKVSKIWQGRSFD